MCVQSPQSWSVLYDLMNHSLSGSSVHGILQARILEWLSCPPPGDLPNPNIEPKSLTSPELADGFFTTSITWEALPKAQGRVKMVGNGSSQTLKGVEKVWQCHCSNGVAKSQIQLSDKHTHTQHCQKRDREPRDEKKTAKLF